VKKEHILVIRFSALGDVAMAVPVVWALATQYPDIRVTVLSKSFARTLFEDLAPNVNFMEADLNTEYHGVKGLNALYRRLVAKQFTKIADLHNVLRSDYLRMRFNLGRYRVEHIDKHRRQRRKLVSYKNKVRQQLPSSFENYAEVFKRLGYPIDISKFHSIFPEEGGNINLLPAIFGPKKSFEQWIGIAPFAAHDGKIYPPEMMEKVIFQLIQKYPKARIFLFGKGEHENRYFRLWCEQWHQCINISRYCENMYQELIVMSHLDVMLSMDSANMHLASLTAIPVVSVWGATHPMAGFLGFNQNNENVIQVNLDCRPCSIFGNKPCKRGDYACLNNIPPERIVERIESIINN
jgi:ADP-heptose:LPS heptosyltransferase